MAALSSLCRLDSASPATSIVNHSLRPSMSSGPVCLSSFGFFKKVTTAVVQYSGEHVRIIGSIDWITRYGRSKSGFEPAGGGRVAKNLIDCGALRGFAFLTHLSPLLPRSPQCSLPRRSNVVELLIATDDCDGTQHNRRRPTYVSLHRGTHWELQARLHCGCRRPGIRLHKMRGLYPKAPFPACPGVHKKRWSFPGAVFVQERSFGGCAGLSGRRRFAEPSASRS